MKQILLFLPHQIPNARAIAPAFKLFLTLMNPRLLKVLKTGLQNSTKVKKQKTIFALLSKGYMSQKFASICICGLILSTLLLIKDFPSPLINVLETRYLLYKFLKMVQQFLLLSLKIENLIAEKRS